MIAALWLAAYLHAPLGPVKTVWELGGLDAVAVVTCESQWQEHAWRRESGHHTSWGLFQINDGYHRQYRDDLLMHIVTGVSFLNECKARTKTLAGAIVLYNGSYAWGLTVERKRDELVRWLLWRWIKSEGIA
jgi:hypothetical protein